MEESLSQRLYNSIGFLNAMYLLANKRENKQIEIDEETLLILKKLLMDCKNDLEKNDLVQK